MKLKNKERIAILGKFVREVNDVSIQGICEAINYGEFAFQGSQENEIFDVRESLLDIEFNPEGFEELMKCIEDNSKEFELKFKHPVFLVKLKDNKIHNLFTDLGRLKLYGFKSHMSKDQLKDYIVVEALNYLLPEKGVNVVGNDSTTPTPETVPTANFDDLFEYLDKIPMLLNEGNISLLNKKSSMVELAHELKNKVLTEEDIKIGNFK